MCCFLAYPAYPIERSQRIILTQLNSEKNLAKEESPNLSFGSLSRSDFQSFGNIFLREKVARKSTGFKLRKNPVVQERNENGKTHTM